MADKQDPLGTYRGKRDLGRTTEPPAGRKRRSRRPRFAVHRHDASAAVFRGGRWCCARATRSARSGSCCCRRRPSGCPPSSPASMPTWTTSGSSRRGGRCSTGGLAARRCRCRHVAAAAVPQAPVPVGLRNPVPRVADSVSWRRFCRIPLDRSVPHPTTLVKLVRRAGPGVVEDRLLRGRKLRVDTTVVKADIDHPTDADLLEKAVRKLGGLVRRIKRGAATPTRFRDRSRSAGRRLRQLSRTLRRRTGQAPAGRGQVSWATASRAARTASSASVLPPRRACRCAGCGCAPAACWPRRCCTRPPAAWPTPWRSWCCGPPEASAARSLWR